MSARFLFPFLLLPFATACGDADAQEPIELTSSCPDRWDPASGIWQSAGWPPDDCEWLEFRGRTSVRLMHELPSVPRSVEIYLSFEPDGRSSAPAAGDLARILAVDGDAIELRNNTNEDFFLKVVLR